MPGHLLMQHHHKAHSPDSQISETSHKHCHLGHTFTNIQKKSIQAPLPAAAVNRMSYSAPEEPPMQRAAEAHEAAKAPGEATEKLPLSRACRKAVAPRFMVEPQSPSPTLQHARTGITLMCI